MVRVVTKINHFLLYECNILTLQKLPPYAAARPAYWKIRFCLLALYTNKFDHTLGKLGIFSVTHGVYFLKTLFELIAQLMQYLIYIAFNSKMII